MLVVGNFVGLGEGMAEGFKDGVVVVGKLVGTGVGNAEGFGLGEGLGIVDGL